MRLSEILYFGNPDNDLPVVGLESEIKASHIGLNDSDTREAIKRLRKENRRQK